MARIVNYRQLPNAAFETRELTGEGFRVLGAIQFFDRGGLNGRGCDATMATIAERALCDTRTAQRWVRALVDMGLLEEELRTGRGKTRIYRVKYDEEQAVKGDTHATHLEERVTENALKGDSSKIIIEQNHIGYEDKDTEGYPAKRRTIRPVETAARRDGVSEMIDAHFPEDAHRFIDTHGRANVGGFLAWMHRKGARGDLSPPMIAGLHAVAEYVTGAYDLGTPEYGTATRIFEEDYREIEQSIEGGAQ